MQSVSSGAVAEAINGIIGISVWVTTSSLSPNTDYEISEPSTSVIRQTYPNYDPNNKIYTFPISVRPINSWSQYPVALYVNSAHTSWTLRSLGSTSGQFEIQWTFFMRKV